MNITAISETLKIISERHAAGTPFVHVFNVRALTDSRPFNFSESIQLRKATDAEMDTIRQLNQLSRRDAALFPRRIPWETRIEEVPLADGGISFTSVPLPQDDWRYFVLTYDEAEQELFALERASVLTKRRIELGLRLIKPGGIGIAFGGPSLDRLWEACAHSDKTLHEVNVDELTEIKNVRAQLREVGDSNIKLASAMQQFVALDAIPASSPLRFLGYVSILESVITHAPSPKDPYDSLTRQVRQKMLLLGKRAALPIPYNILDEQTAPATIWSRLYEYRSAIAHGSQTDFAQRFRCLRNTALATEFVACATASVLRQLLVEPQLLDDLRLC